jgi:transcriptional regulator with XRE-family HTH domain
MRSVGGESVSPEPPAKMTDHIRIGLRVRALRRAKGLTQARLAEEADKSLDAISSLERGKYRSTVETLLGVARALDVPVSALLDGDRADNPKRARLLAALAAAGRSLSDADLETAVEQVNALGRRRKR